MNCSRRWLLIFLGFITISLAAQKHDYHWITGYDGGEISHDQPWFGLSVLKFSDFGKVDTINLQDPSIDMKFFNTTISDENGNLMFYTNGVGLNNYLHQLMLNGDGMGGIPGTTGEEGGSSIPQGGIGVPWPGMPNQYFLLQEKSEYFPDDEEHPRKTTALLYSRINMNVNNEEGEVIEKRIVFLQDTVERGKSKLVRHANGRDWWHIKNKLDENVFYRTLISPSGPELRGQQTVGVTVMQGTGQAVFSPDGSKYAVLSTVSDLIGGVIAIYDFDRCSGLLSNQVYIPVDNDSASGGLAISPNNRYLYQSSSWYVYQYDLFAEDIESSRAIIATYDLNIDWFPTLFYAAQLAPDGRIYIICPNSVPVMHRIEYPDEPGEACIVKQHSVRLPTLNAFSIPNNPNYRLGPIDGSPCDTLGIDNLPKANFRADQDTLSTYEFYFQDLSYYEPEEWFWTFGDGFTSESVSPTHIYGGDGVYEVCLTVSNTNGSHTACDTLFLGIVDATEQIEPIAELQVFPNPFQTEFSLVMNDYYPKNAQLIIYDALGRKTHQQRIYQGWNTIDGAIWRLGIYFYELWDGGMKLGNGKVIKQ